MHFRSETVAAFRNIYTHLPHFGGLVLGCAEPMSIFLVNNVSQWSEVRVATRQRREAEEQAEAEVRPRVQRDSSQPA